MLRRLALLSLAPLVLAPVSSSQTKLAEFSGNPSAQMSRCVGGHDLNADGVADLLIGASFDGTNGVNAGAVFARSGATGTLLWQRHGLFGEQFGHALAMSPDLDGDGIWDLVVGAPLGLKQGVKTGAVYLISGRTGALLISFYGSNANDGMGSSVAADFDLNADGISDIAGGAPFASGAKGRCKAWSGLTGSTLLTVTGTGSGAILLGTSLLGAGDMDGDGIGDLAVGSTNSVKLYGAVLQLSIDEPTTGAWLPSLARGGDRDLDGRADLLIGNPWHDLPVANAGVVYLISLTGTNGYFEATLAEGDVTGEALGSAVASLGDIDGDGWEDWAFGATAGSTSAGHVRVVSGRFNLERYRRYGPTGPGYGQYVGGVGDINSDGVPDLAVSDAVAGASSDGSVTILSGYGPGFVNYCSAGTSSSGCQASISGSGVPSATQAGGFTLSASNVEGKAKGLFFFSVNGRQANAWGNGTSFQCATPPVRRASIQSGTGTNGQCDGAISQDLNALWCPACPKPQHNPGAGAMVQAQLWYRDAFSTSNQTTSLSDALEFMVLP